MTRRPERKKSSGIGPDRLLPLRRRARRRAHEPSCEGMGPEKPLRLRSSERSDGRPQRLGADSARGPERPMPERLREVMRPERGEQETPDQWHGGAELFHWRSCCEGRGGSLVRKERRGVDDSLEGGDDGEV